MIVVVLVVHNKDFTHKVLLSNAQSMKEMLENMLRCKEELNLPWDAEENLVVFSKATSLLQHLEELELLSHEQVSDIGLDLKIFKSTLCSLS